MPRMKARKAHRWADGTMAAGSEYEATENEARLLRALGWASDAPARSQQYQTRVMTADDGKGQHELVGSVPQPGDINHVPRETPRAPQPGNRQQRRQLTRRDLNSGSAG